MKYMYILILYLLRFNLSVMCKLNSFLKNNVLLAVISLTMFLSSGSYVLGVQATPNVKDIVTDTVNKEIVGTDKKKLVKLGPDDQYDRGVPRKMMANYFNAVKEGDLKRAAHYLDLRRLPTGYTQSDGPELARQLKVVLDRSLWVEMDLLSIEAKGHSDDGLPSYQDLVGQIEANKKKYSILLQHVPRSDRVLIWKFSSRTVRDIPKLYDALGYGAIGEELSKYSPDFELLGLQAWQWVFLLLIAAVAFLVTIPFVRLTSWLVRRRKTELSLLVARFINGPLNLLLVVLITRQYFDLVHPSITARAVSESGTIIIIVFVWMLLRLLDLSREFYEQRFRMRDQEHATVLLAPVIMMLKIVIVFLGTLIWLDNIGFSVTTILTGLGVGGIAIALATQKSIENFVGALTLYLAAPVKVGDFCRFGDKLGEIEEIGLRATKIRSLENTVVIVPNAEFAAIQIENLTQRKRYLFSPCIRLHFETTSEQIRNILSNLQQLLNSQAKVIDSPQRVNFIGFGSYSLDIEIHCYIDTVDINEFKNITEELNLRIMEIIQSAGTRISIPSQVEYSGQELEISSKI